MKIDINYLLSETGKTQSYELYVETKVFEEEDFALTAPLFISLNLASTDVGIIASGYIKIEVEQTCNTCVKKFKSEYKLDFMERYVALESHKTKNMPVDEYELKGDDFYYCYDENQVIDLTEMVRDLIILNLPIAPKCDINCTVQKFNNNKIIDSRLRVLEQLKVEDL